MATELHHNPPSQVVGYLRDAWKCVQDAELPQELHVAAFTAAVSLVSAKQVSYTQDELMPRVLPAMALPQNRRH